ncbi:hypothetical protein [Fusibacter sp. JL216-2]|uniref:hypothetical protein n=1 Tax=Fusibacter sp. JL216-2 TaxID=3071453 RepID=UPI003D328EC1
MKPIKGMNLFSGNGNQPETQVRLGLFHIDVHIHRRIPLLKIIVAGIALIYWLKTIERPKP